MHLSLGVLNVQIVRLSIAGLVGIDSPGLRAGNGA